MDTLQHDPRTKSQIKEALYTFLYRPALKALKTKLDQIIIKNSVLIGSSHMSFMYKGQVYACDPGPLPRKMNRLNASLQLPMEEYLREIKELNENEMPYVIGFINQVLNSTNELHDYLKVLPEAVHTPIEKLIATCHCRAKSLSQDEAQRLRAMNSEAINLIKKRMFINLLQ